MDEMTVAVIQEITNRRTYQRELKQLRKALECGQDDANALLRAEVLERRIAVIDSWTTVLTWEEKQVITGLLIYGHSLAHIAGLLSKGEIDEDQAARCYDRAVRKMVAEITAEFEDVPMLYRYLDYGF